MEQENKFFVVITNDVGDVEVQSFENVLDLEIFLKFKYKNIKHSSIDYRIFVFEGKKWKMKKYPIRFVCDNREIVLENVGEGDDDVSEEEDGRITGGIALLEKIILEGDMEEEDKK